MQARLSVVVRTPFLKPPPARGGGGVTAMRDQIACHRFTPARGDASAWHASTPSPLPGGFACGGEGIRFVRGFTLLELMVTIALLVILVSVAAPNFQTFMARNQLTAAANELMMSLQFARSEAIRQRRDTTICPSSNGTSCLADKNDWTMGWIILQELDPSNQELLYVAQPLAPSLQADGPSSLTYVPAGNVSGAPERPFAVTHDAIGDTRCITVTLSGSTSLSQEPCD